VILFDFPKLEHSWSKLFPSRLRYIQSCWVVIWLTKFYFICIHQVYTF